MKKIVLLNLSFLLLIITSIFCLSSCKWLFSSLSQDHFLMIKGMEIGNFPK